MAATDTRTWPELAVGLYDKLTERNAEIAYHFTNLNIGVPSSTESGAAVAQWNLNGELKITTRNLDEGSGR